MNFKINESMQTDRFTEGVRLNMRLAQWRLQWLIEHSTSHQLLCWADSFVLRNPPERKARKRCVSC